MTALARRAAFTALATLALLASVAAQEVGPDHFLFVEEASLDLRVTPDLGGLTLRYDLGSPDPVTGAPACGSGEFNVSVDGGWFLFEEGFEDTGCGEASLDLLVPAGATDLVVTFMADRNVTESNVNPPQRMLQRMSLRGPHGALLAQADYFDRTQGSQPLTPFLYQFPVSADAANLSLVWRFADEGADFAPDVLPPVQAFQRLRANVTNVSLQWPTVPLPLPAVEQGRETALEDEGVARAHLLVNASVTPALLGLDRVARLSLEVRTAAELVAVHGPMQEIPKAGYNVSTSGDAVRIVVREDHLLGQGPGNYTFDFLSARALPATVQPGPPATIAPLFYTLVFLPMAGAVLAVFSAATFRREAEGRYVRGSTWLIVLVGVLVVYYAFLLLYAFFRLGRARMWTLPLEAAANLLYIQFVVLLVVLVLVAVAVNRYGLSAMRRDLKERHRQEAALRRSNEELERFAYVASHDLQEPLRKVAGFTALLQRRYKGRLDRDADEMIEYAVDGATRMQALIRDILAYSRVNSKELDIQVVDVGALMDLVVTDLSDVIKGAKAQVTWRGLPTLRADPAQLRQVLQNLVENAIKYRHPKRKPRVEVSAAGDGDEWTFRVADNGVGVPADKADEVFGIFRRLHGRDVPGTGIGLAIVKKALERHGGTIRVEPRRGGGSVFIFTLPYG